MPNEILAKSKPYKESLVVHTEYVIAIWKDLKKRYEAILNKDDNFWRKSFLSVLFHDFGKVVQNFQLVIQDKKKYDQNYIRHEFVSGVFLYYSEKQDYDQNPFSLFAVFSHHKPLIDTLFQDDSFADITALEEDMTFIFEDFNNKIQGQGFSKLNPKLVSYCLKRFNKIDGLSIIYHDFESFFRNFKGNFSVNKEHRNEYILYKALLNISDWTASGHTQLTEKFSYTIDQLKREIVNKLRNEGKEQIAHNFRFREFQIKSKIEGSVLAIAPTGSGKTEAALIWASQKPEYSKILYLLPTRVTSNAIYKRLTNYFSATNTAITHSSALLFRREVDDNKSYAKTEYLKDKTFFRNITVCTIDQILTQGFNLGYWEIKTFHSLNARIIIDEIHLFEPYTLGLIIATIQYLKNDFGAKFYIMTATMPKKLKILLQDTLQISENQTIEDKELLEKSRSSFEIREKTIEDSGDEVSHLIDSFNKVLIVVNTVDAAINLYNTYKERKQKAICFHSRFIQKDRQEKESIILEWENTDEPILLIATQVVEVSLDIDYDLLLTENAPMDSIVQRAGRVNRKRKEDKKSKVIVFMHHPVSEDNIYKTVPDALTKTFDELRKYHYQKLTEKQLAELVDTVYANFDVTKHTDYLKAIKIYKEIQFENHYIKDVIANENTFTRLGLDTINVIPAKFEEELYATSAEEKTKYEVSIRRTKKYGTRYYQDKKHSWFTYIEADYNSETGLKFKAKGTQNHAHTLSF